MEIHINSKNPLIPALGFEVEERPIFDSAGNQIQGYKQIVNNATGDTLNVATKSYTPVKNERLIELAHKFTENTPFTLEGYATYGNGEKVMAYLKNTNPKPIVGNEGKNWLIIGNSHDGSTAFFTGMTQYIYRCQNMFSEFHQQNRIRHTYGIQDELFILEQTHQLYYNHLTGCYEMYDRWADTRVNGKVEDQLINYVLKIPADTREDELSTRTKNNILKLRDSLETEVHQLGHNLWGLFNGVTHYTTHQLSSKKQVFGNAFNIQADINNRAREFCQNITEGRPELNIITEAPNRQQERRKLTNIITDVEPAAPALITTAAAPEPPRPAFDSFSW